LSCCYRSTASSSTPTGTGKTQRECRACRAGDLTFSSC
jgi:hypothetical protein